MRPLVIYSGGLDSTYLVQTLLLKTDIDILYVEGNQDKEKSKIEMKVRERAIKHFNENYPFKIIDSFHIKDGGFYNNIHQPYNQQICWLTNAFRVIEAGTHSSVQMGYVKEDGGDDIHDLKVAFKHLWRLKYSDDREPIDLEFPLAMTGKHDILAMLDIRLFDKIWICEQVTWKRDKSVFLKQGGCGQCIPCATMMAAITKHSIRHGFQYQDALALRYLIPELEKRNNESMSNGSYDRIPVNGVKITAINRRHPEDRANIITAKSLIDYKKELDEDENKSDIITISG